VVAGRKDSEQKQPSMIPTVLTSKVPSVMMTSAKRHTALKTSKKSIVEQTKKKHNIYSSAIATQETVPAYFNRN
jgi:hypothetical protein